MIGSAGLGALGIGASVGGSIFGGLAGQGGANAAAGTAMNMANQAYLANRAQMQENRSDASPWTGSGRMALSEIGQLLGWGRLDNEGRPGSLWEFSGDPTGKEREAGMVRFNNFLRDIGGTLKQADLPTFNRLKVSDTFEADPGYAFRQAEGQKALERSASARGKTLSGEQFKALSDFNSGLASQEYGNWWNRYTGGTAANNATAQQEYANKQAQALAAYAGDQSNRQNYLNLLTGLSGQGASQTQGMNSLNSGLTGQSGNYLNSAGQYAGNAYMQGANALASGIGSGINNAMTGAYLGWGGSNPIFGGRQSVYGTPEAGLGSVGGMPIGTYRR